MTEIKLSIWNVYKSACYWMLCTCLGLWIYMCMQSGCCKPPVYCGYRMKNVTFWEVPKTGAEVEDSDCRRWSNIKSKLCYDCKSCKRGVLADTRQHHWRPFTVIIAIAIVVVSIMYALGCYTLWSNRSNTHLIINGSRYPPSHSPIHPPWSSSYLCVLFLLQL